MKEIDFGIHTFELFLKLSYAEIQEVISSMYELGDSCSVYKSRDGRKRIICNYYFRKQGILLCANQFPKGSGLLIRVTPCTVLSGEFEATQLYHPKKETFRQIVSEIENCLDFFDIDIFTLQMSLSRADPCVNILCDSEEEKKQIERIIRKSVIIPHYTLDSFDKDSVQDSTEMNKHSYRQSCKAKGKNDKSHKDRSAFTVYDKVYQLQRIHHYSSDLFDKHILRIEAELTRPALLPRLPKWIDKQNNLEILQATYRRSSRILRKFLQQMLLVKGDFVPYAEAVQRIQDSEYKGKIKEKMQYLIEKTSRSDNLSYAIDKTRKKFNLSKQSMNRLLKKFEKLQISPITLPNNSTIRRIPPFTEWINDN